jgi:hypothetical protein
MKSIYWDLSSKCAFDPQRYLIGSKAAGDISMSMEGILVALGFTYGSSRNDWHLWVSEHNNSFIRDLFQLAER